MEWSIGRWHLAIGTKNWHNYISLGSIIPLDMVIRHFQFCFSFGWKPSRPHFYDRRILKRVLPGKRWTETDIGIVFWPVRFGIHWHPTCWNCVGKYSRDYGEWNNS